jgi:hypothetical protein
MNANGVEEENLPSSSTTPQQVSYYYYYYQQVSNTARDHEACYQSTELPTLQQADNLARFDDDAILTDITRPRTPTRFPPASEVAIPPHDALDGGTNTSAEQ